MVEGRRLIATTLRLTPCHDKKLAEHAKRLEKTKAELARTIIERDLDGKRTLEQEELMQQTEAHFGTVEGKLQVIEDELFELKRAIARLLWRMGFAPQEAEGT